MIPLAGQAIPAYALLAAAAAAVTGGVAAVALRNRSAPGAGWLAAVMLLDAAVAAFAVGGHLLPYTRRVALAVGGLGLLAAVPFVAFVVSYTGRGRHLTYWSLLGYGGPLFAAAALYATTEFHDLMLRGPVGVRRAAGLTLLDYGGFGPLLAPTLLYVGLLVLGTLLLLAQTVVRHERLYLGQSAALFVGAAAPLAAALPSVGAFSRVTATGPRSVAVAAALMVAAGGALGYAAARHRLFEFVPAVRQLGDRAAVDDLDEGILIVDGGGNVVKRNAAATEVLGLAGSDVVGSPAARLFEGVGVEDLDATPATFERGGRTYEVTSSPITDERDRPIGRTYVLRDVTRRERRKQRLQVLNRVLRHNVRNDMSVVRMNAGVVAEEGDPRLAELGANMVDIADELVDIGEKVRRTEQLLSAEELARQDVDVEDLLSSVVDEATVGFDPVDATVEVAGDVGPLSVNRELLALALENAVENAVEHNDATVPRLAVTADRVEGGVRVTVADDGPGIPAQELAALEAGRETDLQHASSLGLWLVLWSVERLGGDLTIEHLDPTGTAVAVWLPDDGATAGREPLSGPDGEASGDRPGTGVDEAAVAAVADGVAEGDPDEREREPVAVAEDDGDGGSAQSDPVPSRRSGSASQGTPPPPPPASASPSDGDGVADPGTDGDGTDDEEAADGSGPATSNDASTGDGPPRPPTGASAPGDGDGEAGTDGGDAGTDG